jgi:hypothetical protein
VVREINCATIADADGAWSVKLAQLFDDGAGVANAWRPREHPAFRGVSVGNWTPCVVVASAEGLVVLIARAKFSIDDSGSLIDDESTCQPWRDSACQSLATKKWRLFFSRKNSCDVDREPWPTRLLPEVRLLTLTSSTS